MIYFATIILRQYMRHYRYRRNPLIDPELGMEVAKDIFKVNPSWRFRRNRFKRNPYSCKCNCRNPGLNTFREGAYFELPEPRSRKRIPRRYTSRWSDGEYKNYRKYRRNKIRRRPRHYGNFNRFGRASNMPW